MNHNILKGRLVLVTVPCFLLHLAALGQRPADLVVVNANIRTIVTKDSRAAALAVSGNRFVAVGTTKQIRKLIGPSTRVIDARGRLLLPGFNDSHVHFMTLGNTFSTLDLRGANVASDMTDRISRYAGFLPKGRWILGGGWDAAKWTLPDQKSVDAITPDNPVFLYHADASSALANAVAFKLAGLPAEDRDANGIVRGDALRRIAAVVPRSHTSNWLEIAEAAMNYAASLGVTSVQDMHSDDSREIYRELHRLGKLKTRVYDCIALSDRSKLSTRERSDDMIRGGCLKSFSDGDAESSPRLLRDVIAADKAGFQIMVHAIGNSANDIVLTIFEKTEAANGTRDRRFRVEHAHDPRTDDIPRFSRGRVIASMQPHLFSGRTGEYYSRLLKSGGRIAFGSDASITDFNPLLGIHAAVNARSEALSVYDAVRAYTAGSAYAEFQETEKGTIEAGKLADFVILSDDIFTINPLMISKVRVTLSVVDGRLAFRGL